MKNVVVLIMAVAVALVTAACCLGLAGYAPAQDVAAPAELRAKLTTPATVTGPAGTLLQVRATSPATVFVWLPGTAGLDVYTAAPGLDQSTAAVSARTAGTYRLWCVATLGDVVAIRPITVVVTGGGSPTPPQPAPTPMPAPPAPAPVPPAPSPAPAVSPAIFVVVVETAAGAPTRGQIFADPALMTWGKIHGVHWRIVAAGVVGADGQPPADVAPYLAAAAGQSLPWVFVVDAAGRQLYAGALPATAADLLTLIRSKVTPTGG